MMMIVVVVIIVVVIVVVIMVVIIILIIERPQEVIEDPARHSPALLQPRFVRVRKWTPW